MTPTEALRIAREALETIANETDHEGTEVFAREALAAIDAATAEATSDCKCCGQPKTNTPWATFCDACSDSHLTELATHTEAVARVRREAQQEIAAYVRDHWDQWIERAGLPEEIERYDETHPRALAQEPAREVKCRVPGCELVGHKPSEPAKGNGDE